LFWPAIVIAPSELLDGVAWGDVAIRSVKLRPWSGSVRMARSPIVCAAPVRPALISGFS
jgi:hypothetical protein